MARPRLTSEQEARVRKAACDAVFALQARGGYGAVSLRRVARASGLTPMGLYRYFPGGRDELIAVARTEGYERLLALLEEAVAGTCDAEKRLRRAAHAFVAYGTECRAEFELLFRVPLGDFHHPELEEVSQQTESFVHQLAEACIAGRETDGDPQQLSRLVYAALLGVLAIEHSGGLGAENVYDDYVDPMLDRLLGAPGPTSLRPSPVPDAKETT